VEPGRRRALVARLADRWRGAQGAERAWASDALWALRPYLPGRLRLRLALGRSPRRARPAALPLVAGAVVAALIFAAVLWGPRLWTPKPDIDWVKVPAGEFLMGSDPDVDPDAQDNEMPQHPISLGVYQIGRTEVTNAQYAQCVRAKVCDEPRGLTDYLDSASKVYPVVHVSWLDARKFCEWVGGRLPTEVEWEYAAAGPEGYLYPWGVSPPDCGKANYSAEEGPCVETTTPAGSYPQGASWRELEDMAGNVWEWTASLYKPYPYKAGDGREDPAASGLRVARGGSWLSLQESLRSASRHKFEPSNAGSNLGFRCARSGSEP
jgi:formylglycine-generating enzyme required for sulfatase activity